MMAAHSLRQKRDELRALQEKVSKLKAEIEAEEQEARLSKITCLTANRRRILQHLYEVREDQPDDLYCVSLKHLMNLSGMCRLDVRRALSALRSLGLALLEIGLLDENGQVAGSGYRITDQGVAWWERVEAPRSRAA